MKGIKGCLEENGTGIATAASLILTGLSIIFAIRSAKRGANILEDYQEAKEDLADIPLADQKSTDELSLKIETGKKLAIAYKESLICAGSAMILTFIAHKSDAKKIAGLTAALALNEDKLRKVYAKADDIFGKGGKEDLREAVDCDNPPFDEDDPVRAKHIHRREEIKQFYESWTGTLFESTERDVNAAIQRAETRIKKDPRHILNFNKWRSILGLMDVDGGISIGFNSTSVPFQPYMKTIMIDGVETIGIFYEYKPESKY